MSSWLSSRRSSEHQQQPQHLFPPHSSTMNRALSIRSNKSQGGGSGASSGRRGFSFSSLRGTIQPELSKKLYKLIKSENNLISAHEAAGRERVSIATQLSEWGEQTHDEAISDISDKVGVILSEMGEQEDTYAHALDDSRGVLKTIRNTEKSVQPSRDGKSKIADEIAKLKSKEPESAKLVILEQELVRAEAENLVAEAQLTNITRQKLKEAYEAEFAATIERAEKQIILARHGQRLLKLLDDSPVVPGDARPAYVHGAQARQILNDAEDDLREWQPETTAPVTDQDAATVQANNGHQNHNHQQENRGLGATDRTAEDASEANDEGKRAASITSSTTTTPPLSPSLLGYGVQDRAEIEGEGEDEEEEAEESYPHTIAVQYAKSLSSCQGSRHRDEESSVASPRISSGESGGTRTPSTEMATGSGTGSVATAAVASSQSRAFL